MECAEERRPERRNAPPARPPPPASTAARNEEEATAADSFHTFQRLHDKAFVSVNKGLSADEAGDVRGAEEHYTTGLALLDRALAVDCDKLQYSTQDEKDTAKQMQTKMNKTRLQIGYRLEGIRSESRSGGIPELSPQPSTFVDGVRLPSYDEATSTSSHSSLISDQVLGDSIMETEYPGVARAASAEATRLFTIEDGVQIFFITPQGFVSAPSYPSSLHVVKFEEAVEGNTASRAAADAPPAFLHVGEWFYPMIPGASPVLHTSYGAYIFPDLSAEESGSSVGLMLPDSVSEVERQCFEDILRNYSAVQEQRVAVQLEDLATPTAPPEEVETVEPGSSQPQREREGDRRSEGSEREKTSEKISRGIIVASEWISWGVGKGAEKASQLISAGGAKLREKLKPENQARPVDPRVQQGMVYARSATHTAVKVSGFIVNKLGEATMALGRQVAPHLREKGEKMLPKSMKGQGSRTRMDSIIEVAASGLQGFGTVYMSLESAAKALGKSLANETVSVVHHKYGEPAGKLTENTVYTVGNVALTAYNADHLGVKAVAKRAAKDTGKAVLHDLNENRAAQGKKGGQGEGAAYNGSHSGATDGKKSSGEKSFK